jgi:hypothetical protein
MNMGTFDMIVVLDTLSPLRCSEGHALRSFRTKDLPEPAMSTYLVRGGNLYLAAADDDDNDSSVEDARAWRIEGAEAIYGRRHQLQQVQPPPALRVYGSCSDCEPVLVRSETAHLWCDIVVEHPLAADFRFTFRAGEPLQIERLSGTRADLEDELRARGLFVLEASDALAAAHLELKRARGRALARTKEARR